MREQVQIIQIYLLDFGLNTTDHSWSIHRSWVAGNDVGDERESMKEKRDISWGVKHDTREKMDS
jgi:hypothetical protein